METYRPSSTDKLHKIHQTKESALAQACRDSVNNYKTMFVHGLLNNSGFIASHYRQIENAVMLSHVVKGVVQN
jgi:hypothetical protein